MPAAKPEVFYDGACPVCQREIGFYQKQDGAENIEWIDVSRIDAPEIADGLSRDSALRRFHVRKSDGTLVSGASAFSELWINLPKFRFAGRLTRLPVIRHIMEAVYRVFLVIRQSWRKAA